MARGWAVETVENSAKNNCAEFSTVPTAPTAISSRKREEKNCSRESLVRIAWTIRSQKRKNHLVPATFSMAGFEVIMYGRF
jgi:hypothetical protein